MLLKFWKKIMKARSFIQKFINTFKSLWSARRSKTASEKSAEISIFGKLSETRPYVEKSWKLYESGNSENLNDHLQLIST